jgi:hypothetical protein
MKRTIVSLKPRSSHSRLSAFFFVTGALVLGSPAVQAQFSPLVLPNTGLDANGNKLTAAGQIDANWRVVAEGTGNVLDPSATVNSVNPFSAVFAIQNSNYNNTPTDAGWIWDTGSSGNVAVNRAVVFEIQFDLTGYNVTGATISGYWGADNAGILSLNGMDFSFLSSTQAGTADNFRIFTPFLVGNLNPEVNTLQVTAINAGTSGPNPAAVLVGGLQFNPSLTAVPEPSTYGLIGALLLLSLIAMRRFRQVASRK